MHRCLDAYGLYLRPLCSRPKELENTISFPDEPGHSSNSPPPLCDAGQLPAFAGSKPLDEVVEIDSQSPQDAAKIGSGEPRSNEDAFTTLIPKPKSLSCENQFLESEEESTRAPSTASDLNDAMQDLDLDDQWLAP